jgi:hypothetical protein
VETPHEWCARLAQHLIKIDRNNELLRYFNHPKDGSEWREIRSEFFGRFGPEGVSEDDCVGPHLEHFYMNLGAALQHALKKKGINVD